MRFKPNWLNYGTLKLKTYILIEKLKVKLKGWVVLYTSKKLNFFTFTALCRLKRTF